METAVKRSSHGSNVRRWREWRGINQDVLAEKVGVSQATFSGYEKRDKLEEETLEKIAKALDIPLEAITEIGTDSTINIFSGTWQDNANANASAQQYCYSNLTYNPLEKVVELYERLLKAEQEKVTMLHEIVSEKK